MISIANWFSQVASITLVNLRTVTERKGSALTAAVGIAGVVLVLIGVLSIAEGFRHAMRATGADDVALVLRTGADTEMTSGLQREETRVIADAPGLARDDNGALASPELFVIINLPKRSTGTDANVPMRGVGPSARAVRANVKLEQGRWFEPGRNEVVVGAGAARAFAGTDVGHTIKLGTHEWLVVGVFSAGGGAAESEIWTDAAVLQPAYHRGDTYQSVLARLSSTGSFQAFKDALTSNPRLSVKVLRQSEFFAEQSTFLTNFIRGIGFFIAFMMALGAFFAALNTMYGAVAARVREIATLRALGFGTFAVIVSVLLESLVVAIIGGASGAVIAYLAFNGYQATTMNWQTFSQVAFAFRVTPSLMIQAIVWASIIGLLGGLFPAIHAARTPIATALRET
ncbi:ABC transporter permease [Opitutaceae bacterium EW11]|nr:ABC transporter permease [Opitutaceae bacterium EW11]